MRGFFAGCVWVSHGVYNSLAMDPSFRAEELRSLHPIFSSSSSSSMTDSYFTQQARRAGFLINEFGGGGERKSDGYSREEIERELEKEMIREQIIAKEIIRVQDLEADVRRNLAIEREMEMRRRAQGIPMVVPQAAPGWPMMYCEDGYRYRERVFSLPEGQHVRPATSRFYP